MKKLEPKRPLARRNLVESKVDLWQAVEKLHFETQKKNSEKQTTRGENFWWLCSGQRKGKFRWQVASGERSATLRRNW